MIKISNDQEGIAAYASVAIPVSRFQQETYIGTLGFDEGNVQPLRIAGTFAGTIVDFEPFFETDSNHFYR